MRKQYHQKKDELNGTMRSYLDEKHITAPRKSYELSRVTFVESDSLNTDSKCFQLQTAVYKHSHTRYKCSSLLMCTAHYPSNPSAAVDSCFFPLSDQSVLSCLQTTIHAV